MSLPEFTIEEIGVEHRGEEFHVQGYDHGCVRVIAVNANVWLEIGDEDTFRVRTPHTGPMHWAGSEYCQQ